MRWAAGVVLLSLGCAACLAVAAPDIQAPADAPAVSARTELGYQLFYDADLSIDGTMSCTTRHERHRGFTDGNATH
jgi:cytochrome c peroxidase